MEGAGAVFSEGGEVGWGSVSLMLCETVLGVGAVELGHDAVAGDLCDDAGGGDTEAGGVAFDDGVMGDGEGGDWETVDEGEIDWGDEGFEGAGHGEVCGGEDAEACDGVDAGGGPGEMGGGGNLEESEEFFAVCRGEFFGVVDLGEGTGSFGFEEGAIEVDGGGDDGACEGAAAGFIDACEGKVPGGPGTAFVCQHGVGSSTHFSEAATLTGTLAQVIELGAAGTAGAFDFDFDDVGGMEGEDAFDAFAEGEAADGEGFVWAAAVACDDRAGVDLDAFLIALTDFDVDADAVADFEGGDGFLQLALFDFLQEGFFHDEASTGDERPAHHTGFWGTVKAGEGKNLIMWGWGP